MNDDIVRVVTPGTFLPVSVADVRAHASIEHNEHNKKIEALISAALTYLQGPTGWLGRSIVKQTLSLASRRWCYEPRDLPCGPVISVSSIAYFDTDNAAQTLPVDHYFLDDATLLWGTAFNEPALYDRPGAVKVTYVAGYASPDVIPAALKLGIMQLVTHWYENPEPFVFDQPYELHEAAAAVLAPFRLYA